MIAGTGRIEAKRLVALGCLSEVRGSDSAGVGWVRDTPKFLKIAQNPLVAYPVTLYPAIRQAAKYQLPLIGHTRQATTGAVTSDNAHPFLDDGILFAHNGIIMNHETFGKYEVDSQSLIHGIKKRNFSEYIGPIALVWLEEGKLHAFRKGNPLYRGTRRRAVYLASSETYLKEIGCTKIKELSEGRVYCWKDATLENVRPVPSNQRSMYVSTTYDKDSCGMERQAWREHYGEWNHVTHRFEKYNYDDHKTIDLVPVKKEPDTLTEIDQEAEAELTSAYGAKCTECKIMPRQIASDYCIECIRNHWHEMGGH